MACLRCEQEAARRARRRRQIRIVHEAARALEAKLWAARIAAHPDRGGSAAAFIRADAAWRRFQAKKQKRAA